MAHQALTSLQDSTSPLELLSATPAATTRMAFGKLALHFQAPVKGVHPTTPQCRQRRAHQAAVCWAGCRKACEEQQDVE